MYEAWRRTLLARKTKVVDYIVAAHAAVWSLGGIKPKTSSAKPPFSSDAVTKVRIPWTPGYIYSFKENQGLRACVASFGSGSDYPLHMGYFQ